MATMSLLGAANVRLNAQPTKQQPSRRFTVVTRVGIQVLGKFSRPSWLAAHHGKFHDGRQDFAMVTEIGGRRMNHQRNSIAIHKQGEFRPFIPAIYGTGAGRISAAKRADLGRVNNGRFQVQLLLLIEHG